MRTNNEKCVTFNVGLMPFDYISTFGEVGELKGGREMRMKRTIEEEFVEY